MLTTNEIPKVGDSIYVDTALFLSRGADDRQGGLATITEITVDWIKVEPFPTVSFGKGILREQERLKAKFGEQRAYADPDFSSECNED